MPNRSPGLCRGFLVCNSTKRDPQWLNNTYTAQKLQKSYLLSLATGKIEPLQDAVDLDIATESEISQLKAWKKFRVLVNRVDASLAPDIEWPEMPE